PEDVSLEVFDLIDRTQRALDAQLAGFSAAQSVRTGFEVAILGPPNAGKSTLLNALAGRDAAMTSDIAGTTRDIVEVRLDLGGLPVTMLDTAGIRHSEDRLEKMGVELAKARADAADLRIFVSCRSESMGVTAQNGDIFVDGKGDLAPNSAYPVSGATQLGLDRLLNDITTQLSDRVQGAGLISHERQKQAMIWSAQALVEGAALVVRGPDVYDLAAEEIRSAVRALESLIGRVDVETVLGEIFSQFCVGK
ncbi:MAG: GTPase, partial [Primorskyibacter sp.]